MSGSSKDKPPDKRRRANQRRSQLEIDKRSLGYILRSIRRIHELTEVKEREVTDLAISFGSKLNGVRVNPLVGLLVGQSRSKPYEVACFLALNHGFDIETGKWFRRDVVGPLSSESKKHFPGQFFKLVSTFSLPFGLLKRLAWQRILGVKSGTARDEVDALVFAICERAFFFSLIAQARIEVNRPTVSEEQFDCVARKLASLKVNDAEGDLLCRTLAVLKPERARKHITAWIFKTSLVNRPSLVFLHEARIRAGIEVENSIQGISDILADHGSEEWASSFVLKIRHELGIEIW